MIQPGGATLTSLNEPGFFGDCCSGRHEKHPERQSQKKFVPGALSEEASLLRLDAAFFAFFVFQRVPTRQGAIQLICNGTRKHAVMLNDRSA